MHRFLLAVCLALTASIGGLFAAQPTLTGSAPRGMQRGTTQTVTLTGTRLKDARQILMDVPGINVKSVKAIDNAKVEIELEVPKDAVPGFYPLRLVTESGISNMVNFSVGVLPTVEEQEPNSEFESPQAIDNNVTVEGKVAQEDVDYFAVQLKKGDRLTAEVEGTRLRTGRGDPFFDPYVAILDSQRFELAVSDDAPLLRQDSVCSTIVPEDGQYIVMVRDSSFGGRNDQYRLHIGAFPRPIAVIPAGGSPGEVIDATFVSIDGGQRTEKVQLPSEPSEKFPLVISDDNGVCPSPNYVRVGPMSNVIEQEPNDSFKASTHGTLPAAFCGVIGTPGDNDYFSFDAKKGQTVNVSVFARRVLRSQLDSVVGIFNDKGGRVGGTDDSGGPDSVVDYKIPADGKYHVRIGDHLRGGGPGHAYRAEVKLSEPSLVLSLPDRRRYEATHIAVPQGNRTAVMLNASRKGFGGAINISGLNLPDGVTMTPIQMPANRTTVPLLLSAKSDAQLDARLVKLTAVVEGRDDVRTRFDQQHQLVIGQNNSVVYEYRSNRAAIAVTKASPCKIEIVPPQVPIVRNGSMDLKVKIDRGSYDANVSVRMLYNPPGIGSSGSIKFPKGQSEASIPLTANGAAAIGDWPIIIYATLSDGNGSYEIASEPVNLTIADRIFTFGFPKTSAELGAVAEVIVDVEIASPLEGKCEIELLGIPANVTCENTKVAVTDETERVTFPVKISEKARVGQHKTLVARARIESDKGVISQTQGTGILQIDKPLPPKKETKPKPVIKKPEPAKAAAPVKKKPLSRLEQLRQMRNK